MRQIANVANRKKAAVLAMFGLLGCLGCVIAALPGEALLNRTGMNRADDESVPGLVCNDEISRRVARHGGRGGEVQISLMWQDYNDLDLHTVPPSGKRISFANKRSRCGGVLDVDCNADEATTDEPVENINWQKAPAGIYKVYVHYYENHGGHQSSPYDVRVVDRRRIERFHGEVAKGDPPKLIYTFRHSAQNAASRPVRSWRAVPIIGCWTALIAIGLAAALLIGQSLFERRPVLGVSKALLSMLGAIACGFTAGALGQVLYAMTCQSPAMAQVARSFGWVLLGTLLGGGMGLVVPKLPAWRAAIAGGFGGLIGSLAFSVCTSTWSDTAGRFIGAGVVGLCIGLMIAVMVTVFTKVRLGRHVFALHTMTLPRLSGAFQRRSGDVWHK